MGRLDDPGIDAILEFLKSAGFKAESKDASIFNGIAINGGMTAQFEQSTLNKIYDKWVPDEPFEHSSRL